MRIAIDISPLKSDHGVRGTGSYTKSLIESLQKYESSHSYYFFTRTQNILNDVDVVHYPYFDPFFLTLPLVKSKPMVVTVHDLIPLVFPDKFPSGLRGQVKWHMQRLLLRQSEAVITDSLSSKRDIHAITGINSEKINVVYLAPAEMFRPQTNVSFLQSLRHRYHLSDKTILYVGDVNWNKNLPGLLVGYAQLVKKVKKPPLLALVGKSLLNEDLPEVQEILHVAKSLGIDRYVRRIGFVSPEELQGLYTLASVYIQPSFAEGFGLPLLEAMACGCPVIAARGTSLDEIAGPAIRVDPQNPSDIAKGIIAALQLKNPRQVIKNQFDWVKRYSWKQVAHETRQVYEQAIS